VPRAEVTVPVIPALTVAFRNEPNFWMLVVVTPFWVIVWT